MPSSLKLFEAAKLLDPSNSLIDIGLVYLHLHKLELKQAISKFEKVLAKEPENEMAKTFLGIALSWTPTDTMKGEKLLSETQKSDEKPIKNLSETALDFVDKFIKKDLSPVEIKKNKE